MSVEIKPRPKEHIVISKRWNEPHILIRYDIDGISIKLDPTQFAKAVALALTEEVPASRELPNPLLIWSKEQLRRAVGPVERADQAAIARAFVKVLDEMKMATIYQPPAHYDGPE